MGDRLFAGEGGYHWFFGTVENSNDPLGLGRVQVRIVGHHNADYSKLPTYALPYASVILPVTGGAIGGVGTSYNICPGTRVFGFFLDGEVRQQPCITGILTGQHMTAPSNALPPQTSIQQPNFNPLLGTDMTHVEQSCPDGSLATEKSANVTKVDYRGITIDKSQFVYPCTGYVCDYYGSRNGNHHGVDLSSLGQQTSAGSPHLAGRYRGAVGTPIFAIADGVVSYIFHHSQGQKQVPTNYDSTGQGSRSFGNAIGITHNINGQAFLSIYAHLGANQDAALDSDNSGIMVSMGQTVKKGERIGTMGRSHNFSTPTHLHFQIHLGGKLESHGLNTIPPSIIFPKMQNTHTSILSWVNSTLDYKTLPIFTNSQLPLQSLEVPI